MWERFKGQVVLVSQLHLALHMSSGVAGQGNPKLVMGSRSVLQPPGGGTENTFGSQKG